jgi:hypothetical protein
MVDPALLDAGLARFLGTAGPGYVLDYVTLGAVASPDSLWAVYARRSPRSPRPW